MNGHKMGLMSLMNNKLLALLSSCLVSFAAFGLDEEHHPVVSKTISLFQTMDIEEISNSVAYPLTRSYPIKDITNSAEFIKRFDEVFDSGFIQTLATSSLDDWQSMGWRGLRHVSGDFWIDISGKFLQIRHETGLASRIKREHITKDKARLHESVNDFERPVGKWQTESRLFRIDDLGEWSYRLVIWEDGKQFGDKPDVVLLNGVIEPDGSGGNRSFIFVDGNKTYIVNYGGISSESSPYGHFDILVDGDRAVEEEMWEKFPEILN